MVVFIVDIIIEGKVNTFFFPPTMTFDMKQGNMQLLQTQEKAANSFKLGMSFYGKSLAT